METEEPFGLCYPQPATFLQMVPGCHTTRWASKGPPAPDKTGTEGLGPSKGRQDHQQGTSYLHPTNDPSSSGVLGVEPSQRLPLSSHPTKGGRQPWPFEPLQALWVPASPRSYPGSYINKPRGIQGAWLGDSRIIQEVVFQVRVSTPGATPATPSHSQGQEKTQRQVWLVARFIYRLQYCSAFRLFLL